MKDLIISVFNILKYAGRFFTHIRNFFLNLVLVLILIAVIIGVIPRDVAEIPSGTVLKLNISGDIVEEKKLLSTLENLLGEQFSPDAPEPETALQDILDIINQGAEDDNIAVLLLDLKNMGRAGINQLQSIGQALKIFKDTGKPVVAAEDYYSQSQYFLASYSDKIIVNPMGGVDLHGFGVYRLYFKEALEKLEINYNVFKVGTYKSALEPFTRNSMSPADKQQSELWLAALWQVFTDEIAKQRNISLDALHYYTDNMAEALSSTHGDTAQLALETGLVDQISTRLEINAYLASLTKNSSGPPHILSSRDYLDSIAPSYIDANSEDDKIGLIIAEGKILPGKQAPGMIGGDSLAKLIKKARENKDVKALVLRINSGGGSAFASEIIRQELLELKKSGKPIVVSMGAVAASGGYWIAADADEIWASPATITGSIGIFGAIPTFEKTLASLGVYRDGIGTTPLAAGLDITQPLPEQLKSAIQQTIVYNYDQFLQIVANGRNLEKAKVAELAQGRVYDGQAAKTLGLVDKLGTLEDAIGAAAELAKLEVFTTEYIRPPVSVREHLLHLFTTSLDFMGNSSIIDNSIVVGIKNTLLNRLNEIPFLDDPRGVYAQCLVHLTW
ncbi:MAG: signal peptide peptidase SppA [Desulfobulbaceae bacterium]|nr:signal peptide peptidase SppA [Desulfobulbaceae bacterium]